MIPIISYLLANNESLFAYERGVEWQDYRNLFNETIRRMTACERASDVRKPDHYYKGLEKKYLKDYHSFYELFCFLPKDISARYFQMVDRQVYVRSEYLSEWIDLISQFSPLFLIAAYNLDEYNNDYIGTPRFDTFVEEHLKQFEYTALPLPYIPELELFARQKKGLIDLHIHLNGSTEADKVWNELLQNPEQVINDFSIAFEKSSTVRILADQVIPNFSIELFYERINTALLLRTKMLRKICVSHGWEIAHKDVSIYETVKYRCIEHLWDGFNKDTQYSPLIKELIIYLMIMDELIKTQDDELAAFFHQYLLIKGIVHRLVAQQVTQIGFSQFQMITNNDIRWRIESKEYIQRFLQLSGLSSFSFLGLLEGRFAPKDTVGAIRRTTHTIFNSFKEAKKWKRSQNTQLVLVAHFIKKEEKDSEKWLSIRHRSLRIALRKQAWALLNYIASGDEYSNKIVGVDAAASEFHARPEVFAPIFRLLRKHGMRHFTFHVGEDFVHLVSGIRAIDETIIFLDLQVSDRLGHCTAIGIDPGLWINRIGSKLFISQGEWLDDLVYIWMLIHQNSLPGLQVLQLRLESLINEYSYKVYGEVYPIYILAKAWEYRKYDPLLYYEEEEWDCKRTQTETWEEWMFIKGQLKNNETLDRAYRQYHDPLLSTKEDLLYDSRSNYDKIIEINTNALFTSDILRLLQTYMLKKISELGIVIETLPTSNLRISYYENISEYHLLRWLYPEEERMDTCPSIVVGSDDPGIFMTNIYNEYAQIYQYLKSSGYTTDQRMKIMEDLYRHSITYNFCH